MSDRAHIGAVQKQPMTESEFRSIRMTGPELRSVREDLGMTPTHFAARLGVSSRTLDRYEKGESPITRLVERAVANLQDELATVSASPSRAQDGSLSRTVAARKSNTQK